MGDEAMKFDAVKLAHLILASLEQVASAEQVRQLNDLLRDNPKACRFYKEFVDIHATLRLTLETIGADEPVDRGTSAFRETVQKDLDDSAIRHAIALAEAASDSEQPVEAVLPPRQRPSAAAWRRFALHAAAVVLLCLTVLWFDRYLMQNQSGPVASVAVMTDALQARWQANGIDYRVGEKIYPGELVLESGWVKFQFYHGAEVIVEAPAAFSLTAVDNMSLQQGRLYAKVPREAIGFTVSTPNSKTIDLGTEFGLLADGCGNTDLHVFKGKTQLVANRAGETQLVEQGDAKRVDAQSSALVTIALDPRSFACRIDGRSGKVWSRSNFSTGDVINVDFGDNQVVKEGWNTMARVDGTLRDVITSTGKATTISVSLPVRFNGQNTNGTTEPTGDAQAFPAQATSDSFYGNDVLFNKRINPKAQLLISNLDPALRYELTFSISRMNVSDNRQTQYVLSGDSGPAEVLYLNPTNNTGTAVTSRAMAPSATGAITVDMQKGPENDNYYGYFYLGLMVVKAVDGPGPATGVSTRPMDR